VAVGESEVVVGGVEVGVCAASVSEAAQTSANNNFILMAVPTVNWKPAAPLELCA